MSSPSAEVMTN